MSSKIIRVRTVVKAFFYFLVIFLLIPYLFLMPNAAAKGFPSHSITYIIPFNPGGQSDTQARMQQPLLKKALHTNIIIAYKAGGGGALGWSYLVHSKPNGYTISGINLPHIVLQPLVRGKRAGYMTNQIVPLVFFQRTPIGLAVLKTSPFKTLKQLVKYAKKHPNSITVGGSGTWTGHYMTYLELEQDAGIKLVYVPATGAAPSVINFLSGYTQALFANSNDLVTYRKKIRILAVASKEPLKFLPGVPTFKELGYNIAESIDRGIGVPQGVPLKRREILIKAFMKTMHDKHIINLMIKEGFEPLYLGPKQSEQLVEQKKHTYSSLLKKLHVHF